MKSYAITHSDRIQQLRDRVATDAEAAKKLVAVCRTGMLVPYWEKGEPRPGGPLTAAKSNPALNGSRLKSLEGRIARALSPTERAQFEQLRDTIEREEEKGAKKQKRAVAA